MTIRTLAAAITSLAVISGCSSTTPLRTEASPTNVNRAIQPATAVKLKPAEDLPLIAELPKKFGEREVSFTGFVDDNNLFGTMGLPEPEHQTIPGPIESRTYPFIYDLRTEEFTVLDESCRRVTPFVADIAATADSIVWLEGHDLAFEIGDFEIRAFDRKTGTVTKLGRLTDTSGKVIYGDDLLIHEGNAYFSTRTLDRKKGRRPAIHAVPVDGSQAIKVLVHDAEGIQLDGGSLTYEQNNVQQALDLGTGETTPVPANRFATDPGFCGAGTTRASEYWCVGRHIENTNKTDVDDPVLTFKEASGRTTTIATPSDGEDQNYPVPQDIRDFGGWIGITVSGGDWPAPQFLIDLKTGTARIMPKDTMLTETSPGNTLALFANVTPKGDAPQRVVKLPPA
ncbi:hypothetical protein [Aeromicrobium sp. P5_D10]